MMPPPSSRSRRGFSKRKIQHCDPTVTRGVGMLELLCKNAEWTAEISDISKKRADASQSCAVARLEEKWLFFVGWATLCLASCATRAEIVRGQAQIAGTKFSIGGRESVTRPILRHSKQRTLWC